MYDNNFVKLIFITYKLKFFFFQFSHRRDNCQKVQHFHRRLSTNRDDCSEIRTTQGRTTVEVCWSILLCYNGPHDYRYIKHFYLESKQTILENN